MLNALASSHTLHSRVQFLFSKAYISSLIQATASLMPHETDPESSSLISISISSPSSLSIMFNPALRATNNTSQYKFQRILFHQPPAGIRKH